MLASLIFQTGQINCFQTREKIKWQGDTKINVPFHRTSAMSVGKTACVYISTEKLLIFGFSSAFFDLPFLIELKTKFLENHNTYTFFITTV